MQVGRRILRTALIAGSALGLTAGGSFLALASGPAAQASTACAAAWSSTAVYTAGDQASENGINYTANWWTQGNDPATNNGGSGSGQPWTSDGSCTGGGSGSAIGRRDRGQGPGTGSVSGLLFSPYKDVTINMNWNTYQMQSAVEGSDLPVVGSGSLVSTYVPKLPAITLAFATGACGSETWGGVSGADLGGRERSAAPRAGLNYVVSTGGEAGTFTCDSTAGMESFIAPTPARTWSASTSTSKAARPSRISRTWSPRRREHSRSTRTCSSRSRSPRWEHPMAATAE